MEKLLRTFCVVVLAFVLDWGGAQASVYLQDAVNYPAGTQLGNNAPWVSPQAGITVANGFLSYSNFADLSPTGNVISISTSAASVISYRPLNPPATNGAVYVSFLNNYTTFSGSFFRAGLLQSSNTAPSAAADPLDLVDNSATGGYKLGVRGKGGTSSYLTNSLVPMKTNTIYLVVMKYNFTNGTASLWVNPPTGSTEPTPDAASTSSGGVIVPDLTYFYVRSASASTFLLDTIRVGSTWADVTPAPVSVAAALAFVAPPTNSLAGATISPVVVQIQDQFGNSVAQSNVPVSVSLDASTFADGTTTVNSDANGQATFTNLVMQAAGTYVMTASVSGNALAPVTSDVFDILAAPTSFYGVNVSAPRSAGVPFSVTVTAYDAFTNSVTTDSSTLVTLGSSGALMFDGNGNGIFGEPPDNGAQLKSGSVTVAAVDNVPETITITATDAAGKTGSASGIVVTDERIAVTLPGEIFTSGAGNSGTPTAQTAGAPFTAALSAVNSSFVVDTGFSGSKTILFTGPGGLPAYPATVNFSGGIGTAQVTLTQAQSVSITATESSRAGTPSSLVKVLPGNLDHFSFAPIGTQLAGTPFNVIVTAKDFWNNTSVSFSDAVNFATTAGTISPTNSGAFIFGVATQSVTVTSQGAAKTITATRINGMESGMSSPFAVVDAPIGNQAAQLSAFLDSFLVQQYWVSGKSVNWLTGASGGSGPNMTIGSATHCSAFAAGVAEMLGVYLLRPPDASDLDLANHQADWLRTNQAGWFPIPGMTNAQHMVNTGLLVVASYKSSSGSGHIAVLRPSTKSDSVINAFGPEECQSGTYNFNDTNVATGFNQHSGAFPNYILYYGHPVTYPISPITPVFQNCTASNRMIMVNATTVVGRKYELQWTSNFLAWTDLNSFTNSNNSSNFFTSKTLSDASATNATQRFYRLLAQ